MGNAPEPAINVDWLTNVNCARAGEKEKVSVQVENEKQYDIGTLWGNKRKRQMWKQLICSDLGMMKKTQWWHTDYADRDLWACL